MSFEITGTVTGGNRLGRRIGFPTANIPLDDDLPISDGVYAARVNTGGEVYGAMAYVGRKPSVGAGFARSLEVSIFDFEDDLYGKQIRVEILDFVRSDRKFDSIDELRVQIAADETTIREILKTALGK